MGRFIYKRNSQFKFLGKHCVNYKKYRLNKNSGLKVAPHPKKLPTFGLMAQRIFPTEKRTHIAIEWVAFFCQRIAAHFFYLTPDTSFGALFSLQNTPRESMPTKSITATSPENTPFVGRHHLVVLIPEPPLCYHRFFLGFLLSSKSPSQNNESHTHYSKQHS